LVEFKVRADSLEEVSRLLQIVVSSFDLQMSHVESRVHQVVGNSWRGPDADTFMQGWDGFQGASADVRGALEGLALTLRAAAGNYDAMEAGIKATVTPSGSSKKGS